MRNREGNSDHRPWPPPAEPWRMAMVWHDLLFLHWPVAGKVLRARLPAGMELDTHEGQAWLAVVPFRMSRVRARRLPAFPGVSAFPELNVRTYVRVGERPGVYFFTLDAHCAPAVYVARWMYGLNYLRARMRCTPVGDGVEYESVRVHRGAPPARFAARYGPVGAVYRSQPGALDHWFTERYCLYTADRRGAMWRAEIDHEPWPLQPAEAEVRENTMVAGLGMALPDGLPLLHFGRRLEVVAWAPRRVE